MKGMLLVVGFGAGFAAGAAWMLLARRRKKTQTLVLTDDDVRAALPMATAIEVNRRAFLDLHFARAQMPPRHVLPVPRYDGFTLFKPCFIPSQALGLKVVSPRPSNSKRGLPTIPATVLLFDEETGLPNALIDATFLTALRTAAGSAVATDALASPGSRSLVVFGAGLQAEAHIDAVLCVRPQIDRLHVVNRTRSRAEKLVCSCAQRYPSLKVARALALNGDAEEARLLERAVRGADVICTASNSRTPVFRGSWLRPGAHINGVGSYTPAMQEVDDKAVRMCRVVVDGEGALSVGDLSAYLEPGEVNENVVGTLGELLAGDLPSVHHDPSQCTFFKSVGVAVQDIATAAAVLARAKDVGLGKRI